MSVLLLLGACRGGGDERSTTQTPTTGPPNSVTTSAPVQPTSPSVTTSPSRSTIATTAPPAASEIPLDASLVPEKANLSEVTFGKATVNGKDYTNALIIDPFNSGMSGRLEINASRNRVRFIGDLGIPDNQRASTAYKVEIFRDLETTAAYSTEVRFGETKRVDLEIPNVLRIKMVITPLTANAACCDLIAMGDPRLRAA